MSVDHNFDCRSPRRLTKSKLLIWNLFLFSAVFFLVSAVLAGDAPGVIAALLFLIACVVYLVSSLSTLRAD